MPDSDVTALAIVLAATAISCTPSETAVAFEMADATYPAPRGPRKIGNYHRDTWLQMSQAAIKHMETIHET